MKNKYLKFFLLFVVINIDQLRELQNYLEMSSKRISIRVDEHTLMMLDELSERTCKNMSLIVRSLLKRELDTLTDRYGYFKDEKHKEGNGGQPRDGSPCRKLR